MKKESTREPDIFASSYYADETLVRRTEEKSWAWVPVPLLKVALDSTPHGGTSLYFAFLGHKIKVERKNDAQDHFELWMFWIYSSNKFLSDL